MDSLSSTFSQPRLGKRDIYGQRDVDQLHASSDQVEVIRNLLDGGLGHVRTEESVARNRAVDLAELSHERHWLAVIFSAIAANLSK